MSEKKAKEQRQKQNSPQVTQHITAIFYDNGAVHVNGFPLHFKAAMQTASLITSTIASYFVDASREGRMKNGVAEKKRILKVNTPLPGRN